jgi:DNA-binding NarL/FixJ family response regulator
MEPHASPIRVVVCDDVAEMRALIRMVLEEHGDIQVVGEAETGKEAARQAAALVPDAIVLDLSMPDMDGLEAIPLITSSSPRTAIVVFSGFSADRIHGIAMELGAHRYLEKGTRLTELSELLQEVVAERREEPRAKGAGARP